MSEGYEYGLVGGNPLQAAGEVTHFFSFMLDIGETRVPSLIAVRHVQAEYIHPLFN